MTEPASMRVTKISLLILTTIMLMVLVACGQETSSQGGVSYKETKSMVLDILKSEEAQKVMEEVTYGAHRSGSMQLLSTPEGQQIQTAVKEILTDPNYPKHLQNMMTDPKFAGEFAKAVQKENKEIHKQLLNDPEYQSLLMDLMDSKPFKEIVFEVMKSQDFRKQMMTVMQDSLETPVFRMEMMELMQKIIHEESKPKKLGDEKEGEDEQSSGGGGGEDEAGGGN
mgnify:CR=1 FL=1